MFRRHCVRSTCGPGWLARSTVIDGSLPSRIAMCGLVPNSNCDDIHTIIEESQELIGCMRAEGASAMYAEAHVPKRGNWSKGRLVHVPYAALKCVQRQLVKAINFETHPCAFGFVPGKSVLLNAMEHVSAKHILTVDFANFFQSVKIAHLRLLFRKYSLLDIEQDLILLTTLSGSLPTGAPTSPVLSNAVCAAMDAELAQLTRSCDMTYSRYADDITVSSDDYISANLIKKIESIAESYGFILNPSKTRFSSQAGSMRVTGLVVNKDDGMHGHTPRIPRRMMRRIRVLIHRYNQLQDHEVRKNATNGKVCDLGRVIAGYIAWARGINPIQANRLEEWLSKGREYDRAGWEIYG
jgi:RNA-directed DNA polymerase